MLGGTRRVEKPSHVEPAKVSQKKTMTTSESITDRIATSQKASFFQKHFSSPIVLSNIEQNLKAEIENTCKNANKEIEQLENSIEIEKKKLNNATLKPKMKPDSQNELLALSTQLDNEKKLMKDILTGMKGKKVMLAMDRNFKSDVKNLISRVENHVKRLGFLKKVNGNISYNNVHASINNIKKSTDSVIKNLKLYTAPDKVKFTEGSQAVLVKNKNDLELIKNTINKNTSVDNTKELKELNDEINKIIKSIDKKLFTEIKINFDEKINLF